MDDEHRLIAERKRKLDALRAQDVPPYPYAYDPTHRAKEIQALHANLPEGGSSGERVRVAGRLVLFREMGKLAFGQLQDGSGKIQLMFRTGSARGPDVKLLDLGDFLGASGEEIGRAHV